MLRRSAAAVLLSLSMLAAPLVPATGGDDPVSLVEFEPGRVLVRTDRYEADLRWVHGESAVPTDRPVWGEVTLADGQRMTFGGTTTFTPTAARVQNTVEPVQDGQGLPNLYRVQLIAAEVTELSPERVTVRLNFSFMGATSPAGNPFTDNFTGFTRLSFVPTRVEHEYGYRFPTASAHTVRVNHTYAFSREYAERLSVDPAGNAVADNGESLDGFNTWKSYKAYGFLFRDPARSSIAFDLHRVNASYYTYYLVQGRARSQDDGAFWTTHWTNQDHPVTQLTASGSGLWALDFWNFPHVDVSPVDLARFYYAYNAGRGGGGGGEPPPQPPNDRSVWPLRCPDGATRPDGSPCERVVVAVVDTGINPYHAWFRRPGWTAHPATYVAEYPADARAIPLTFGGDYDQNRLTDAEAWAAVERRVLHTIPGTSVIGAISFGEYDANGAVPILDELNHGTHTAAVVTESNPDALLVVVETGSANMDAALEWVAAQPWIDVVSISWGSLGNAGALATRVVGTDRAHPEVFTRTMAEDGKVVVAAAGNDPTPGAVDTWDGPSWMISVGGATESAGADWALGSRFPDVVSDVRRTLPAHKSVYGHSSTLGTSFACPRVAGTLSQSILESRVAAGHLGGIAGGALVVGAGGGALADGRATAWEFRAAMNATARWFTPEDYRIATVQDIPVAPVAPWLQMGWGYVGPKDAAGITAIVLGEAAAPEKPLAARLHMEAVHAARETYWRDAHPHVDPLLGPPEV